MKPTTTYEPGILDNEDLFSPQSRNVGAIEDMFSMVSDNRGAIGYEVWWMSERQGMNVRALKVGGLDPGNADVLFHGEYPLYRAIYLTLWEEEHTANPYAKDLVDFLSAFSERKYEELGIVPASILRENGWKFKGDELVGEP